ncbi:MAG: hypothetical protein LBK42_13740, partial [Propionibacteriaceae bacterium]|nr:hypothetical protein [Propionibacteriaceae bacterium]
AAGIIGLVNLTEQERAMITAQERQRDKLDGMLNASEKRGLERGLERGLKRGQAEGRAAAQTRLAEILRLHPEADPQTILRLMAEDDA